MYVKKRDVFVLEATKCGFITKSLCVHKTYSVSVAWQDALRVHSGDERGALRACELVAKSGVNQR